MYIHQEVKTLRGSKKELDKKHLIYTQNTMEKSITKQLTLN